MRLTPLIAIVLALPSTASAQVEGTVRDTNTGQAIPGAVVSVQASPLQTLAAGDGSFTITEATGADLVVTAAAVGYFTASAVASAPAQAVDLTLDPLPAADNPAWVPASPTVCGGCHFEQRSEWEDSPMALAGRNAWVADIYDGTGTADGDGGFVYLRDSPAADANPDSECAACHQPESWVSPPYGALEAIDSDADPVVHGVSCDVCHKMAAIDETRPNFPGLHPEAITLARPYTGDAIAFGLLTDVDFHEAGRMRASYQPQLAAAACAACHQDKNDPDEDGDFEEDNGVISEPTYLEWLASPYADPSSEHYATCVDCHMPATDASAACDLLEDLGRPPGDVRSHRIEGTTAAYLENALSLAVHAEQDGEELAVRVDLVNDLTGHHVPTGVTIRNVILLVEAVDDTTGAPLVAVGDQVVHELGGVGDPSQGYVAGLPGKLYAKVNHGADGTGPVFFTDATGIQFDSRIPALATDTTNYRFELPAAGGPVSISARVIYRRSWRSLLDAKRWTADGHGQPLADVAPPHYGHLMEETSAALVATPAPSGCGCGQPIGDGGPALLALLAVVLAGTRKRGPAA